MNNEQTTDTKRKRQPGLHHPKLHEWLRGVEAWVRGQETQLAQLTAVSTTLRTMEESETVLREMRTGYIRQLHAKGFTHSQLAEITGLTRGRINQIINRGND